MESQESTPQPELTLVTPQSEPAQEAASSPIEELQAQLAQMKDQWMRAVADAENSRKRAQRELEESRKFAVSSFARDLVGVLENLQRALASIPPAAREHDELLRRLAEGVELTSNELIGVFERFHIRRIDPIGTAFDHQFHQAVTQLETADAAPGTVVQVVQAGYTISDRLLRPALVVVAKAPSASNHVDTTA